MKTIANWAFTLQVTFLVRMDPRVSIAGRFPRTIIEADTSAELIGHFECLQ
jgi:hypothetical protein